MMKFLIELLVSLAIRATLLAAGSLATFLAGYALAGVYGGEPVAGGLVTLAVFAVFVIAWTWVDGRKEVRR